MEIQPIKSVRIDAPPIIPTIDPPVTRRAERSVTHGLSLPIINVPDPTLNYPVVDVPTQEEFDAAVRAEQKKKEEAQEEKTRGLPDAKPPVIPQVQVPVQETKDNRNISDQPPTNTNLGVPVIEVPIVGEVPIPPKEQVILAGTTATASVAAALVGKSVVEWLVAKMKPIVQQIFVRGKKLLSRDLTPYELQVYFAFEKSESLKKVNKLLKKEQKKDKQRQYKEFHNK
jgi:hypothetical protein